VKILNINRKNRLSRAVFLALMTLSASAFCLMWGVTHSQQEGSTATERGFENTIPAHVPIKVKLKSEKSFKDLNNKGWARELELEVKNTGSKPIRYLYVIVLMPDFVLEDGAPLSFRLKYGRHWLVPPTVPVDPNEPPIMPGGSIVMRIPESKWKGYESIRNKKKKDDPKKVRLELQLIDFGDGTALESPQGVPLSYPVEQSSSDSPPAGEDKGVCRPPSRNTGTDYAADFS